MDTSVKISTIIPVYNAEKYIEKCLESILNQSFKDIEVICINDGSTDGTLKILENYSKKDNRINIISTENHGQGHARNIGINQAKGEYISFVDADDWLDLNAYELLYNKSKLNNLDMLFFQMVNYEELSGELVYSDSYDHKCFVDSIGDLDTIFNNEDFFNYTFLIPVCPVSKLYKASFLKNNDIKFPEGLMFEDNIFHYKSYFLGDRFGFLNQHLYFRRRHDDSVTKKFTEKQFDIIEVSNLIINLFIELGIYDKYKDKVINHTFMIVLEWFNKFPLYLKEKFYKLLKNNFIGFNSLYDDFNCYLSDFHKSYFDLMHKKDYYVDFISEFLFLNADYSVIPSIEKDYKISIIIPTYNTGLLLHRTISSIENQSLGFNEMEIILVDDGSNRETLDLIKYYANNYANIKAIFLNNNTGSSGTPRNVGIYNAAADYIMFLDHDDFFEFDALEKLYLKIMSSKSDVVFGTYSVINNSNLTNILFSNEKHGHFNSIEENENLIAVPPPSIWTKLFNKQFILDNNILFPTILGEDAIFMSKVLLNANGIDYLYDLLVCYHDLNDDSTTNNVSLNYLTEGLISEKYLLNLYKTINKEYYFKFRCIGNLDFFLTQFLKSNLSIGEIHTVFPLFKWFIDISNSYNLEPNLFNNKIVFNYISKGDIYSLYIFKKIIQDYGMDFIEKGMFGKIELRDELINDFSKVINEIKNINKENLSIIKEANSRISEKNEKINFLNNYSAELENEIINLQNKIKYLSTFKGWLLNKRG